MVYHVQYQRQLLVVVLELVVPVDERVVGFPYLQKFLQESADLWVPRMASFEEYLAVALAQCAIPPRCWDLPSLHMCLV